MQCDVDGIFILWNLQHLPHDFDETVICFLTRAIFHRFISHAQNERMEWKVKWKIQVVLQKKRIELIYGV